MTTESPVAAQDRLAYLDILRGFAVLMIFVVNIKAMAMPFGWYMNPTLWGGENDMFIAKLQSFLVDNKWRTNFTALFGAGLVLIAAKFGEKGGKGRILLRLFILLLFGIWHLVFIWSGDILTMYALAGFLALWFARMRVGPLVWWASILLVLALIWTSLMGMAPVFMPGLAKELGGFMWGTDPEYNAQTIREVMVGPAAQIPVRAKDAVMYIGMYGLAGGFMLLTVAIMLWGMILFKTGWYKGESPVSSYVIGAVAGLGVGWVLEFLRYRYMVGADWTFEANALMTPLMMLAGLAGAFGYSAVIALLFRAGVWLRPFSAAGRMAFTNYIACSLIGTTLYGPLLTGRFGEVSLQELMVVVGATWAGILIWSPLWLMVFRFGPLEWLWRSLTYWKIQPFRR